MSDRRIAQWSLVVAVLALVVSACALLLQRLQYQSDYEEAVVVSPGVLPLKRITSAEPLEFELSVINTAKSNTEYFLRVNSNAACVDGINGRPQFIPCTYESRIIRLSKPEAGSHQHIHKLRLQAPSSVDMPLLAYSSDPKYFLEVEIISSRNGRSLFQSTCYYTFNSERKSLDLYEPVLDTSGQSKVLQAMYFP